MATKKRARRLSDDEVMDQLLRAEAAERAHKGMPTRAEVLAEAPRLAGGTWSADTLLSPKGAE